MSNNNHIKQELASMESHHYYRSCFRKEAWCSNQRAKVLALVTLLSYVFRLQHLSTEKLSCLVALHIVNFLVGWQLLM